MWESLIISNETDVMTQKLLQLLFASFSITTKRLLLDRHLGGKHHTVTVTDTLVKEIVSVPTTNVVPDRDFAIVDRLVREKPNASIVALQSMIPYSHHYGLRNNHWRNSLEVARKFAPSVRKKFNERLQVIEERRTDALLKDRGLLLIEKCELLARMTS